MSYHCIKISVTSILKKLNMKKIILLSLVIILGKEIVAQTTIANFDCNGSSLPMSATSTASNITASVNGTEADAAYSGTATGTGAFTQNTTAGNALSMANSSGTNTRYWTLTLGGSDLNKYINYKVYFQSEHSTTGATVITISYSTDGTTFTALSNTVAPGLNTTFTEAFVDLSGASTLNNQTAVYIRFAASGASATGTLRIDNLEIQAATSPWTMSGGNVNFTGGLTATTFTTTGDARVTGAFNSGATTVASLINSGNLNVAGTTTLSGAVTTGALTSGSTSVSSLSNSGNLSVNGTSNFTGAITTGPLTSGVTTVSSLNSSGNISATGILTASTLSVTGGATFDSIGVGNRISFGGGQSGLGFIAPFNGKPGIIYTGRQAPPSTLSVPCNYHGFGPSGTVLYQNGGSAAYSTNGTYSGYVWNSFDGANGIIEATGNNFINGSTANMLLNYYCGSDVAICVGGFGSTPVNTGGTNSAGGVVSVGQNFQIGGPTYNVNTALNLNTNNITTTAINVQNGSNPSVFKVASNGSATINSQPFGGAFVSVNSAITPGSNIGMNHDGANGRIEVNNGALLLNYASGKDVAICTGPSGIVTVGHNLNVGGYIELAQPNYGVGLFSTPFLSAAGTNISINGPILYGNDGGALGSNQTGTVGGISTIALRWNNVGQVVIGPGIPQGNHLDAVFAVYGKTLLTAAYVNISSSVWSDYVFEKDYKLMSLSQIEDFYKKYHHLPDVPSAKEMEEKGDNIAETDAMLLKKIEELTIHMVELEKQVKELKKANK